MERKLVFLDVDGTILEGETGISDRVRFAIGKARERGHYVCISTGRCMAELLPDIREVGFDGYVCAAGAHIVKGGTLLKAVCLDNRILRAMTEVLEAAGCFYILEGMEHLYVRRDSWEEIEQRAKVQEEAKKLVQIFEKSVYPFDSLEEVSNVNKISYFWSHVPIASMSRKAEELNLTVTAFSMKWASGGSGEVTLKGCHKGEGIVQMAEYLGIPVKDVIAIGDSVNDMEMLRAAGIGIAMGNASEEVKKMADEVTGSLLEDGVYEAFVRHGLCPCYP